MEKFIKLRQWGDYPISSTGFVCLPSDVGMLAINPSERVLATEMVPGPPETLNYPL